VSGEELGAPVAHLALDEGLPVYDRQGQRVGVVEGVMTDEVTGIFEGIVIHTLPLPGRHAYADHEQIAEMRERGVLLSVDGGELHELRPRERRRGGDRQTAESPLEARLRHAWDWVTRTR
jgi:sporulation protein YlmC with PRC-barrel domain